MIACGSQRRQLLAILVAFACSLGCGGPTAKRDDPEASLRARLGIPDDARRVIVFSQSSHLDIDWQKSFDDYYQALVEPILLEGRQLLDAHDRAFYSVCEMAFLKHHFEHHPEEQAPLKAHVARGALRIVGGGMTSPDTLLPETELFLRDFLHGLSFAEDTLGAHPSAAWLPDSFGHSATTPDLLAAMGYRSVAFSRVDGARNPYELMRDPTLPPMPGSNAAALTQMGAADFLWSGPSGGQVLAHWMPKDLYCQGDNLDYDEELQVPGTHIGNYEGSDPQFTDARIDRYAAELQPYARTPYLFVPVGCDFQHPKMDLVRYLDGYNQRRFGATRTWAVAAPFEDYAALVMTHASELPTLSGSLAPYFTGFYGSRAAVKRRVRDATRVLVTAEPFVTLLGDAAAPIASSLATAFEQLARANHHDFVTGTATDAVVSQEQLPLLDAVEEAAQIALRQVASAIATAAGPGSSVRAVAFNASSTVQAGVAELPFDAPMQVSSGGQAVAAEWVSAGRPRGAGRLRIDLAPIGPFGWRTLDFTPGVPTVPTAAVTLALLDANGAPTAAASATKVVLDNARVHAELTAGADGYALSALTIDGRALIAGPSMLVGDYDDKGGLWRLGSEMSGCAFARRDPAPASEAVLVIERSSLAIKVAFVSSNGSIREASLDAESAGLDLAITTSAPAAGTTRTVSFALPPSDALASSQAGGVVSWPVERLYTPTFWPAVDLISVGSVALLLRQSTGVRFDPSGSIELLAVRDSRENACEFQAVTGSDSASHRIEWRLVLADSALAAARAAQTFNRPVTIVRADTSMPNGTQLAAEGSLASIDGAALISAIKPALRGEGVIVRAQRFDGDATLHLGAPLDLLARAFHTDAVERNLEPLASAGAMIPLGRELGVLPTVRLTR
jgi:hypothetical protein